MIVLTTSNAQVIASGAAIVFDNVIVSSGCPKCVTGQAAKLTTRGNHMVSFSGNIGATADATQASLALELSGTPIVGGNMLSYTDLNGNLNNVSKTTAVNNCCGDYGYISVVNTGITSINIGAGATLVID